MTFSIPIVDLMYLMLLLTQGGAQGEKATLGDLKGLKRDGANFEMVDGASFNADKAYKDSKVRCMERVCMFISLVSS
jgi:hypothetical protein